MELRRKRAPSPQKQTSRLQPSEPLHMTTRAASKAGSNASNSRRGSLVSNGQISPGGSHDGDSQRHSKRRKMSTGSKTTPTKASQSSQSQSTASRPSTRSMSGSNLPPIMETPTMTRKRKRASDATSESNSVGLTHSAPKSSQESASKSPPESKKQPGRNAKRSSTSSGEGRNLRSNDAAADQVQIELNRANEAHEYESKIADKEATSNEFGEFMQKACNATSGKDEYELQEQEDVDSSFNDADSATQKSHDKKEKLSDEVQKATGASPEPSNVGNESFNSTSTGRDDDADDDDADAEEDIEGQEEEQEARIDAEADDGELNEEGTISFTKVVPSTLDPTPLESAQASVAGSPPGSSMDQESPIKRAITSMPGDFGTEDSKGKKKLPGRRRAPHANPKVEAALRRQLHLRMNYRAVAKALKPILAELAQRSLKSLDTNLKAHEEASEYAGVKEGLHQHLEVRLAWVQKQKVLDKARLNEILEAEMEMRKTQYENVARNIREQHIIRLQHDFLNAVRQHERDEDDHASDDENDDVIPPLRHITASGTLAHILGPEYHWRSRPAVETERLFSELHQRHKVVRRRRDHGEKPDFGESRPFTTFDPTIRENRTASRRIELLMRALEETQDVPAASPTPTPPQPPPIIANSEATGLQALANASAVSAATDAAMRVAEERAKAQEEAAARARKEQEERVRPSPLSVPKPSLSQPPEEAPSRAPTRAPSTQTSAPTPVLTPRSEPRWESPKPEPQQQMRRQPSQPPPQQLPPRSATSFSQVTLGPSLTETAPLMRLPGLGNHPPLPPHPIIPGLSLLPQIQQPQTQIPGLSTSVAIPGLSYQQHAPPPPPPSQQPVTRDAPVPHQTPLLGQATLSSSTNTPARSQEGRQAEEGYAERSRDVSVPYGQNYTDAASQSRQPKDFWSSLAREAQDNGTGKAKVATQKSSGEPVPGADLVQHVRGGEGAALDSRPLDHVPLGQTPSRGSERKALAHQAPEVSQQRMEDGGSGVNQDRASSRPPLTASAVALEPLSQRLRSTSDSFGPLLDGNENAKPAKKRAPKTSLYGPWPRSRNYDPYKHDRRASTTAVVSQEGPGATYYQTAAGYSTPYHTPTQQAPPPPFPASAPPVAFPPPPPPPPGYASPYGYEQRPSTYQQSPYGRPPTGFSSLPGAPMSQAPPSGSYYGGPPLQYQGPQTSYAPLPPPTLAARPPTTQATYGPQYGGQPILPAGNYGQNGPLGSPATSNAGPAFAQYSQRDEGRRDYGRGRGRGPHSEWKHYQPR